MRPNPYKTADLVTFTEEILNGKLHFLHSGCFEGKLTTESERIKRFNVQKKLDQANKLNL